MTATARLLGDGIENPANAQALLDVAAMFGIDCRFRDTRGLADRWDAARGGRLPVLEPDVDIASLAPLLAVENAPGAVAIYDAPGSAPDPPSWSATNA